MVKTLERGQAQITWRGISLFPFSGFQTTQTGDAIFSASVRAAGQRDYFQNLSILVLVRPARH